VPVRDLKVLVNVMSCRIKICCRAFEESACCALLAKVRIDSDCAVYIRMFIFSTRKGQRNLLAKCFTRKSILRHLRKIVRGQISVMNPNATRFHRRFVAVAERPVICRKSINGLGIVDYHSSPVVFALGYHNLSSTR